MKAKQKNQGGSITGPLLDRIVEMGKLNFQIHFRDVTIGSQPLAQPALYQDSGSGYNANFVDPQI